MENTAVTPAIEVSKDAKTFGMLCHLGALAGYIIPIIGAVLGPFIIWQLKKNEHAFVDDQGKEAVNFQITVLIAVIACIPLMLIGIGFILLTVVGIADLVFMIMAALKANEGVAYRYPFALRLIK